MANPGSNADGERREQVEGDQKPKPTHEQPQAGELSSDDLAKVAGGFTADKVEAGGENIRRA